MCDASRTSEPDERDDPPPVPPTPPDPDDCCRSGCDPCVFDLYNAALERYHGALAEWEARHAKRKTRKTRKIAR